jgi:hypothetical protein
MLRRYFAIFTFTLLPTLWLACDETPDGCEEAKTAMERLIFDVCNEPPYVNTPFCACCVTNQFFSVSSDCTCRGLNFNSDTCYYAKNEQAMPQARDAVQYANNICNQRRVTVPFLDASPSSECQGGILDGSGGSGPTTTSPTTISADTTASAGGSD